MNFDGEWRVAFIHNEHPNLQYGTAPMPVDDAHPELYGSGYINGTIIGMPRGGKHQDQAWAFVKYLTTANHSAGGAVERPPQRADDAGVAALAGDHPGRALLDVPEDLRQSEVEHVPDPRVGAGVTPLPSRTSSRNGRQEA